MDRGRLIRMPPAAGRQRANKAASLLIIFVIGFLGSARMSAAAAGEDAANNSELEPIDRAALELEAAASESGSPLSAESHRILAAGWPSTSPMWPTIDTNDNNQDQQQQRPASNGSQSAHNWFDMIEPFIYADKPRAGDYSLLLQINSSSLNSIKALAAAAAAQEPPARSESPMWAHLSFEYYFNHDPRSTALPLIKIEVNRKEFKYLDPNGTNVRARRWMKFSEQIQIVDLQQLEKHDWLKISLVNRDEPSIVAIRRLEVEFKRASNLMQQSDELPPATVAPPLAEQTAPPPPPAELAPEQAPPVPPPQSPVPVQPATGQQPQPPQEEPPGQQQAPGGSNELEPPPAPGLDEPGELAAPPNQQQPPPQQGFSGPAEPQPTAAASEQRPRATTKAAPRTPAAGPARTSTAADGDGDDGDERMSSAASEPLRSTIKPVPAKKRPGWPWPGRKKRETQQQQQQQPATGSIVLSCHRSDSCDWQPADSKDEPIQWSLARMPSSTSTVQSGYYYVSNRNHYGDSSQLLRVSLNQTDRATIADQNSDYCIDLAIYVTERTRLRMYRLTRPPPDGAASSDSSWTRGSLLLTWAPTLAIGGVGDQSRRAKLPRSRLAAMENGHNGWTIETICFGDFFASPKECGAGRCALGFVMAGRDDQPQPASALDGQTTERPPLQPPSDADSGDSQALGAHANSEQVVGVALLREFSHNVPLKSRRPAQRWLETWQRDELEPGDSWKFYPKLDYQVNANNVSLVNLFDDAHYFIESDWLSAGDHLELSATLAIELIGRQGRNATNSSGGGGGEDSSLNLNLNPDLNSNLFSLRVKSKLVDSNFETIYANESALDWPIGSLDGAAPNGTTMSLNLSITDHLKRPAPSTATIDGSSSGSIFKVVLELVLDLSSLETSPAADKLLADYSNRGLEFRLALANVSISERCHPNPCQHGACQQNGTGLDDWSCKCDEKYRGRRCEFGHWCQVAHLTAWQPPPPPSSSAQPQQQAPLAPINQKSGQVTLKIPAAANTGQRQPKLAGSSNSLGGAGGGSDSIRLTGDQYCKSKLGAGYRCTDIDLALNEQLYSDEGATVYCSCKSDFYLSDDSKCRQTHACHSLVCPKMGQICDESRPFNSSQPCQCNEKQDWFADPTPGAAGGGGGGCIRRQCQDKARDCGFEAHLCIPTLPGERPICKCGPKFALKLDASGRKYCESTACVLPTLNDCEQICEPEPANHAKPYRCACHAGYQLEPDGRTCRPHSQATGGGGKRQQAPHCQPACPSDTQICTELGCRCKPGFIGEGEQIKRRTMRSKQQQQQHQPGVNSTSTSSSFDYTESLRCLNVCTLSYAENKEKFEMIESVCPLGLCDPISFECRCSDPASASLANEKYEPIYANGSSSSSSTNGDGRRVSPLCHLRRVCEPESSSYRLCKSQGAICVPDYTKPAKFDCICPPSSEKRLYGQGTSGEFTCESKCSSKKSDCLRKQAVCKQIDRDQVRCDCQPGFMLQENVCYLARFSYSINLMIVNKYYEPEARFHRLIELNSSATPGDMAAGTEADDSVPDANTERLHELVPQQLQQQLATAGTGSQPRGSKTSKLIFVADYNQCNISQLIPSSVIDDPYEHDIESYLGYIDQCNERLHQNARTYHLNSRLGEDIRQALRQHLRDFTVTTNNSSCQEVDPSGMLLNCTVYLQSNEPIDESTVDFVFNECDRGAHDSRYCWIKPRLLLKKQQLLPSESIEVASSRQIRDRSSNSNNQTSGQQQQQQSLLRGSFNFKQIIPCEINQFCGPDASSVRLDDRTSMCSCKCPPDIEVIDVRDLEPRRQDDDLSRIAIKEICAPRNICGANSTHCLAKPGSVCQYDIRTGSRCNCVYPSYEDSTGKCVEVAFSQLDSTLIVIIIMLGTALLVSVCLNILVAARTKSMFGRSKQYPLYEFSAASNRPTNRSTGVPNPSFEND